jgi:hypothetical protein
MCEILVKLILHNYMFVTYVHNYFLQLVVSGQFWGNVDYPMIMMFFEHLVYNKVVYNSCI